jgi:hypothetical protein
LKVNVFASLETFQEDASHGCGFVPLPRNVSNVSYIPFTAICDVGSNMRAGSIVCTTNEVSTTSVPSALVAPEEVWVTTATRSPVLRIAASAAQAGRRACVTFLIEPPFRKRSV